MTRRQRHVFATFPKGTAASASRRSRTSHTHGMSQSATPAPQNDMTTSCDTLKKTRLYNFSHRHGNFHTAQRQNQCFPASFLMDLLPNRRFVRGFVDFHVTCHKMPRMPRNLHLVTTSRSADNAIRKRHATRHV